MVIQDVVLEFSDQGDLAYVQNMRALLNEFSHLHQCRYMEIEAAKDENHIKLAARRPCGCLSSPTQDLIFGEAVCVPGGVQLNEEGLGYGYQALVRLALGQIQLQQTVVAPWTSGQRCSSLALTGTSKPTMLLDHLVVYSMTEME